MKNYLNTEIRMYLDERFKSLSTQTVVGYDSGVYIPLELDMDYLNVLSFADNVA